MKTKRTLIVSLQRNPSISGYGGFDEWTLNEMTPEQIDYFTERLDKLVAGCAKSFKIEGGWTGSD